MPNLNDKKSLYEWYRLGSVAEWAAKNLPLLNQSEITLNNIAIDVHIIEPEVITDLSTFVMAINYLGNFMPIYEDGSMFSTHDNNYASIKLDDGHAYIGVLIDAN